MNLFKYSLVEEIEEIEWKAWKLYEELPLDELRNWTCGDWVVCYFPCGFSSILLYRSLETLKNHQNY